mgnify:CR=1 FL=1|jgi:hypothetical protein
MEHLFLRIMPEVKFYTLNIYSLRFVSLNCCTALILLFTGGAMTCDSCDENAVFYGTSFSKNHARGKVLYPQHLLTTFCFS